NFLGPGQFPLAVDEERRAEALAPARRDDQPLRRQARELPARGKARRRPGRFPQEHSSLGDARLQPAELDAPRRDAQRGRRDELERIGAGVAQAADLAAPAARRAPAAAQQRAHVERELRGGGGELGIVRGQRALQLCLEALELDGARQGERVGLRRERRTRIGERAAQRAARAQVARERRELLEPRRVERDAELVPGPAVGAARGEAIRAEPELAVGLGDALAEDARRALALERMAVEHAVGEAPLELDLARLELSRRDQRARQRARRIVAERRGIEAGHGERRLETLSLAEIYFAAAAHFAAFGERAQLSHLDVVALAHDFRGEAHAFLRQAAARPQALALHLELEWPEQRGAAQAGADGPQVDFRGDQLALDAARLQQGVAF